MLNSVSWAMIGKLISSSITLPMKEQRLPLTIGTLTSSLEEEDNTLIDLEKWVLDTPNVGKIFVRYKKPLDEGLFYSK